MLNIICTLIPGQLIQNQTNLTQNELENKLKQNGNLPEERAGHQIFNRGTSFISLGGYKQEVKGTSKKPANVKNSLIQYDTNDNKWDNFDLVGNKSVLERNSFGAVYDEDNETIYMCGGITYFDKKYEVLNINNLITIQFNDNTVTILTIEISMMKKELHSFTMSAQNDLLYIQGELTSDVSEDPNAMMYVINPVNSEAKSISPPEFISEKMKVFGSTSLWVSEATLILLGGFTPPMGFGGRSIFLY